MSVYKLKDILKFTQTDFKIRSNLLKDLHLRQIESGIDASGKQFPAYTPRYKKLKAAGKAAPGQASKETSPPDLTLTGKMLSEFKVIDYRGAVFGDELVIKYGIESGKEAVKMEALSQGRFGRPGKKSKITKRPDKKRVVAANQKVGPETELSIVNMFAQTIAKNLTRLTNRPTIIRM